MTNNLFVCLMVSLFTLRGAMLSYLGVMWGHRELLACNVFEPRMDTGSEHLACQDSRLPEFQNDHLSSLIAKDIYTAFSKLAG